MKQLHITIGDTVIVFGAIADATPLIAGMATATVFNRDWNGVLTEDVKKNPTFAFVDPDTTAANPAVAAALAEMETYKKYWLDGNTAKDKAAKEASDRMEGMQQVIDALTQRLDAERVL